MTQTEANASPKDAALKLALEALEKIQADFPCDSGAKRISTIKEALAQPEQEPVACTSLCVECTKRGDWVCAKAIAPQRKPDHTEDNLEMVEKQEPVAWAMLHDNGDFIDAINPEEHARIEGDYKHALYTTTPQRTWVGLSEEAWEELWRLDCNAADLIDAVEAKLKEKNT